MGRYLILGLIWEASLKRNYMFPLLAIEKRPQYTVTLRTAVQFQGQVTET